MGVPIALGYKEDDASGAQVIDGSLRFDSGKSQYLTRTPGSAGNRQTWTWSGWIKTTSVSTDPSLFTVNGSDDNTLFSLIMSGRKLYVAGSVTGWLLTTQIFRDPSAWYHIVLATDTTQSTSSNRFKLYVNGTRVTAFSTESYPSQNQSLGVNNTNKHHIGAYFNTAPDLNGLVTNVYLIDGQALDPSSFGYTDPLTNTWRPKRFVPQATPNNGTTWSNGVTGAGPLYDGGGGNLEGPGYLAFDSNPTQTEWLSANESTSTWTSPSTIPFRNQVRIRLRGYANGTNFGTFTVNGVSQSPSQGTAHWHTVTGITSPLSSIVISRSTSAGSGTQIFAIEVDGVPLLDGDTTNMGANAFYLPLDGNTPIGQDRSGRGNNWTPVNFGGSNTIEKATGALPILNTDGGGKVARVGVRTDSNASSLVLALPLVGIKSDFSNKINSGTTEKTVTNNGSITFPNTYSNFYGGSAYLQNTNTQTFTFGNYGTDFQFPGDYTIECWIYPTTTSATDASLFVLQSSGSYFAFNFDAGTGFNIYNNSGSASWSPSHTNVVYGAWNHFALVRSGSTQQLFVNGVSIGTNTAAGTHGYASADFARIGGGDPSGTALNSYIQDFRIYKGLAKYTQNFIPASTDPDILPDTPSGVAYSSNVALVPSTDGAVAFDGSGDYLSLADNADFDFGSGEFTVEGFAYFTGSASQQMLVGQWAGGGSQLGWVVMTSNNSSRFIRFLLSTTGSDAPVDLVSSTAFDLNKWNHFALTRSGNTFYLFIDGILAASTTSASTIWNSTDLLTIGATSGGTQPFTGFLSNIHIVKGTALYTSNFTPPTAPITSVANTKLLCCKSNSNPKLADSAPNIGITTNTQFNTNFETIPTTVNGISITNNGSVSTTSAGTNSFGFTNGANLTGSNSLTANIGTVPALSTIDLVFKVNGTVDNKYLFGMSANGLVRRSSSNLAWYNGSTDQTVYTSPDDGAWHHLRVTPTDLYFDGTRIQNTGSLANINNEGVAGNNGGLMAIGAYRDSSQTTYNGAVIFGLVRIMPGVDLGAPTVPITTNGTLSGSATIPNDGIIIRNGNTAATNFNPFTVNINTVRGQESGYCTLNPLAITVTANSNTGVRSNGNLDFAETGSLANGSATDTTMIVSSGKWYWEVTVGNLSVSTRIALGIYNGNQSKIMQNDGTSSDSYCINGGNGNLYGGSTSLSSGYPTFTTNDVVGMILDADTGTWSYTVNGGKLTTLVTGMNYTKGYCPGFYGGGATTMKVNFGQKPFKFPPPAGFQPLALANTPRPTIVRPDQYVGIVTYTGTGATRNITVGWKPDFVWIKERGASGGPVLYDTVRGATKHLASHVTNQEATDTDALTSFNSDGFSLGSGYTVVSVNGSTRTYVGWAWKAGGNSNTYNINDIGYSTASAAGLTGGNITPTGASINTKSGFSIIGYTGNGASNQSISHGLSKAPEFIICRSRNNATAAYAYWDVTYTCGDGSYDFLSLNTTDAKADIVGRTAPTSSLFYVNGAGSNIDSSTTYIAYLWHSVPGFSKFGSYTGNNSTDGVYVHLGFRPKFLIVKCTQDIAGDVEQWIIRDSTRSTYNPANANLYANLSNAEDDASGFSGSLDLLSNGFKMRGTYGGINASATYIYAAWAETPSFNLYGGQANAR